MFLWDEPSAGGPDDLHPVAVNWFWRLAVTVPRSKGAPLMVQCMDPVIPGHWAAWIEEHIHVIGAMVGDVNISDAREVMKNSMGDPMPLGLSAKNMKDCTQLLSDGVALWTVFDSEFMRSKWDREDEKRQRTEEERRQREERKQIDTGAGCCCFFLSLGGGSPGWGLRTACA